MIPRELVPITILLAGMAIVGTWLTLTDPERRQRRRRYLLLPKHSARMTRACDGYFQTDGLLAHVDAWYRSLNACAVAFSACSSNRISPLMPRIVVSKLQQFLVALLQRLQPRESFVDSPWIAQLRYLFARCGGWIIWHDAAPWRRYVSREAWDDMYATWLKGRRE